MSQTRWSRWEDGKVMPNPATDFGRLATFLGVTRSDVFELAFGVSGSTEDRLARLEEAVREIRLMLQGIGPNAPGASRAEQ